MLKKSITFEDFNGETTTEDFYFHISEADIAKQEMLASPEGGLEQMVKKAIERGKPQAVLDLFDFLIKGGIGERSLDGKKFFKSQEITDNFVASNAYSVLYLELCTNAAAGAEFVNGIVPAKIADAIPKQDIVAPAIEEHVSINVPPYKKRQRSREELLAAFKAKNTEMKRRVLTEDDVVNMSQDQLNEALEAGAIIEGLDN